MALLAIEGFDHLHGNDLVKKGFSAGYSITSSPSYARFGGQGVIAAATTDGFDLEIPSKSTIYFGTAIKKAESGTPVYSFSYPLINFKDESSVSQIRLYVMPDYSIDVYQGDGTLLGSSAAGTFLNLKWQYLEVKATISATVGEVTLRINENQVLNLTSQDTKNGSDYIKFIRTGCVNSSLQVYYDDLYVDDAQFNGDCRVKTFMPDSISGTNNSFTASAGNKDECVDEEEQNGDTDYIYSNTLNHKQTFGITTGSLGTVLGIQLNNCCRIDEVGTRKITPLIRSNGTDYSGTESDEITADYLFESEIWETDPDDAAAWTQTKLEAAEFGLEITT